MVLSLVNLLNYNFLCEKVSGMFDIEFEFSPAFISKTDKK